MSNITLTDILESDLSSSYLYNLALDYEKYVVEYNSNITINAFLKAWTCIPIDKFMGLEPNDIIYNCEGTEFRITEFPFESLDDGGMYMYVQGTFRLQDGTFNKYIDFIEAGYAYSDCITHTDYKWKKTKKEMEEIRKCLPILITKTNQVQN